MLFSSVTIVSCVDSPPFCSWVYPNSNILSFEQPVNFTVNPYYGVQVDSSLVGYWLLDDGSGLKATDSSGNNNSGTLNDVSWCTAKYESGLLFNGKNSSIIIQSVPAFQITDAITLSCWINPSLTKTAYIIGKAPAYALRISEDGRVAFLWQQGGSWKIAQSALNVVQNNSWSHIAGVYNGTHMMMYINGVVSGYSTEVSGGMATTNRPLEIGSASWWGDSSFNGVIDDVRIYNRALNSSEIHALCSNTQPNPVYFAEYYNFNDNATNNSMLIFVEKEVMNANSVNVTCTSYFSNNRLIFIANDSATLNIWTNLGKPVYNTGIWHSENYTSTLTLNESSIAEINWIPITSPSSSTPTITSTYAGKDTIISVFWNDTKGLGGYIFSSNNTGAWLNSTWVSFRDSGWANVTLQLNSSVGVIVGFREYANNSFNVWGDLGIYAITTTNMPVEVSPLPTPTPTAAATSIPTPSPTITGEPPTEPQPVILDYDTLLLLVFVFLFTISFILAIKKGYITITLDDETQ
jgi:hypothetical protein